MSSHGPPKRTRSPVFHIARDEDTAESSVRFPTPPPSPPRPLSRGASAPILLSNGKPLKSSLKTSSSSPAIVIPTQMHLRVRSEPSTPKNVHFPETDYGLATVCVFKRSARPAALTNPANGDETETEGEDTPTHFPFSSTPGFNYEIDPSKSSPVPPKSSPSANLILESLNLSSSSSSTKLLLTGCILVRNLAFEKNVAIRFTLDDWQTVSEVVARYLDSLSPSSSITENIRARGWDRFTFAIRLEDYAHSLSSRTLWLAARYRINSSYPEPGCSHYGPGGEWWDNNGGSNYRVAFRPVLTTPSTSRAKARRETVSGPLSSLCTRPRPPTTCKDHALGLMVPSFSNGDRSPTRLRSGKLNLFNYVPPTVRATSSISSLSPQTLSPSANTLSTTLQSPSDDDSTSPASSTLSTPSVSPTIIPRVIIGGQPATSACSSTEDENATTCTESGHVAGWDWSTPGKPRSERSSRPPVELVPGSELPDRRRDIPSPPGVEALHGSNSLYDSFVSQWCFARGSSPSHHAYDGGIMA